LKFILYIRPIISLIDTIHDSDTSHITHSKTLPDFTKVTVKIASLTTNTAVAAAGGGGASTEPSHNSGPLEALLVAATLAAVAVAVGEPQPFHGPAADSELGEKFLDIIGFVCANGYGLDLYHARYICGLTLREGVRRADGSLDRTGYLGATADLIKSSGRLQGLDAARTSPREENTTQLGRAVLERDETLVRKLIAAGADLNAVDADGFSPLHLVSRGKENFNVLLKQGKNIVRIADGDARIITLLLNGKYEGKGADVNLQTSSGVTALIWASMNGHEAVVRLLLERGADVMLRTSSGHTALSWARFYNHAAVVALLEARGAPE
jgi:hypothetical protein